MALLSIKATTWHYELFIIEFYFFITVVSNQLNANLNRTNKIEDSTQNQQIKDYFDAQFSILSPSHNPQRGYDAHGLLPAYKMRFSSAHGSHYFPWKLIENTNQKLSASERQRLDKYVPQMLFIAAIDSLTQAHAYTEDNVEEQHDGSGNIFIKLNKYLQRFEYFKGAEYVYSSGKKTASPPPMLVIEGRNWWIEFDDSWISDIIHFFQKFFQEDPVINKWMESIISQSANNTVVQRFHLTSPQKERITFDFCSAIYNAKQNSIWTASWLVKAKKDASWSEPLVKIKMNQTNDLFQYFLLSFEDTEHINEVKNLHSIEHFICRINNIPLLNFHSKGWKIDINKAYWTNSHSFIDEEKNAERFYIQEIELISPKKEKIKIKLILAFEDYAGRIYYLYWTPLTSTISCPCD